MPPTPNRKTTRTSGRSSTTRRTSTASSGATNGPAVEATTASSPDTEPGPFVCPECGRTFARAAALGAHRRAHGVVGSSASAAQARRGRPRRQTTTRRSGAALVNGRSGSPETSAATTGLDRDALLAVIFPTGMPPSERVIREVAAWLDEADKLARLRQ